MNKQSLEKLADEAEKHLKTRARRQRKRMKVSGAKVKELQKIILSSSQK